MKLRFEVRPVYLPLWQVKDKRYFILMGGRGAGRSTASSQYVVSRLPAEEYLRCAIMRAIHSDIRHSNWKEITDRIDEQEARDAFHITPNDMHIDYGQNSVQAHGFKASSGSHSAKLKSLASYNVVWIEEAEEVGEEEFMKLDDTLRTIKGNIIIILSLNPPDKNHWIIKRWFELNTSEVANFYVPRLKDDAEDVYFIHSSYKDNQVNLDEKTIKRYEGYKETNPNHYWQMIKGLVPEVVQGRIYHGWREVSEVPHEARLECYGLDFGYNPDPAAVVAIYYYNGGYILDEICYQNDLKNRQLATVIKNQPQKAIVIADSAEPKSIDEMKEYDVDIVGAEKGPDSVRHGIKKVQGLQISYTRRSRNLKREYENYKNKIDKDGNEVAVEDPNCDNHLMSAIRYALSMQLPDDPLKEFEQKLEMHHQQRERVEIVRQDSGL